MPSFLHHTSNPKAIAIVLGHLGASPTQLAKYGGWYVDRGCSVVAAASPVFRFVTNQSLRPTALEIWKETDKLLQEEKASNNVVPIVIHSFSNGGCFLLEEMEQILDDKEQEQLLPNLSQISQGLAEGCQIYDSCPCFIRTWWWNDNKDSKKRASTWNDAFPSLSWTTRLWYTGAATSALSIWSLLVPSKPDRFWKRMEDSRVCSYQVYSLAKPDLLTDVAAVDQLVLNRQEQWPELQVEIYRYEDSGHCRMHVDHQEEYQGMIDTVLEGCVQRRETRR